MAAVKTPTQDDAQTVWMWRYEVARRAGLSPRDANDVASAAIDSHAVDQLRSLGCPPKLIAKILL